MKATSYFSKLMLIAAAALMTVACGDTNNEIKFQIVSPYYAYVIQTQSEGINYFTPVIGFSTVSSTSVLESGQVLHELSPLGGNVYFDRMFETPLSSLNRTQELSSLSGTYNLRATDDKGKTVTGYVTPTFTDNDEMDLGEGIEELVVTNFNYSGQTITATIGEVENATHYLFFIVPVIELEGAPVYGADINTFLLHGTSDLFVKTDGAQTISETFASSTRDTWIYPAATRLKSDGSTVLIIGQGKLLLRGAASFTEPE